MSGMIERLKRTESPALRHLLLRGRAAIHNLARGHVVRRVVVGRYLAGADEPKLHVGAGPFRLPGWLDTDLISGAVYLDLERRLPFRDDSFSYAFGEHVIEHLSDAAAERLLAELFRVLRPGGVLRLTTPDLEKLVALYEDRNPVVDRDVYAREQDRGTGRSHARAAQVLNDAMRLWGHRWIYDEEDLTERLLRAGFDRVERREPNESPHAALRSIERHGPAEWLNRAEAMCLEATKAPEPPAGRVPPRDGRARGAGADSATESGQS